MKNNGAKGLLYKKQQNKGFSVWKITEQSVSCIKNNRTKSLLYENTQRKGSLVYKKQKKGSFIWKTTEQRVSYIKSNRKKWSFVWKTTQQRYSWPRVPNPLYCLTPFFKFHPPLLLFLLPCFFGWMCHHITFYVIFCLIILRT